MLGEKVCDPLHVESSNDAVEGLGLMPYVTTMQGEKNTYQVEFNCEALPFLGMDFKGSHLKGMKYIWEKRYLPIQHKAFLI